MEEPIQNLSTSQIEPAASSSNKILPVVLSVLVIGLGILTGYLFAGRETSQSVPSPTNKGIVAEDKIVKGAEFGEKDESVFKDTALGTLEAGGIDGEGTHKLIREGGPSQTVYLTSSVLDLQQFVGRKIQIWGETMKAQKAAWLMDVGRVKILE
jgi:hypothetical protein